MIEICLYTGGWCTGWWRSVCILEGGIQDDRNLYVYCRVAHRIVICMYTGGWHTGWQRSVCILEGGAQDPGFSSNVMDQRKDGRLMWLSELEGEGYYCPQWRRLLPELELVSAWRGDEDVCPYCAKEVSAQTGSHFQPLHTEPSTGTTQPHHLLIVQRSQSLLTLPITDIVPWIHNLFITSMLLSTYSHQLWCNGHTSELCCHDAGPVQLVYLLAQQ